MGENPRCSDSALHPFDLRTRESLDRASSRKWSLHPGTIGAWVAEMDFGTAPPVTEALRRAVTDETLGYLAPATAGELGRAAAEWMADKYGWRVPAERVHAVSDVMAALRVAIEEYSEAGSAVIVPTPAYMPFLSYLPTLGRRVVEVPGITRDGRWTHDLDAIDDAFTRGARTLVLCNPHNPTGTILRRAELEAVAEVVERHGGRVFADEIHAPLRYDGLPHIPYASISPVTAAHTITGTSASKAWNIPGLKAAQLIISNDRDESLYGRIGFAAVHGASTLGVVASTAAYRHGGDWLDGVLRYLDGNRRLLAERLADELPEIGFSKPEGTYLGWLDLRALGIGDRPTDALRERWGLTLTDGALCGDGYAGHARLVFATPRPVLEEAIDALVAAARHRSTNKEYAR